MTSRRLRLHVLCEDALTRRFVEQLADRCDVGPRQRKIVSAPRASGSAAQFVLEHYVEAVRRWRSQGHDPNVLLLVVIDGDEHGVEARRRQLERQLAAAQLPAIGRDDPRAAIIVPTWHVETWIAWLCGHRPVDEQTRYKAADERGRAVGRAIEAGEYTPRRATEAWLPAAGDEAEHVPSLAAARGELRRLGLSA